MLRAYRDAHGITEEEHTQYLREFDWTAEEFSDGVRGKCLLPEL